MKNLFSFFFSTACALPERVALQVDEKRYTYRELLERASCIASALNMKEGVTGVLAERSITAYTGILSILGSGMGYVPLNPRFPLQRTATMITLANCKTIIVGQESLHLLNEIIELLDFTPRIIVWNNLEGETVAGQTDASLLPPSATFPITDENADSTAYIMFTSGTTGVPKGVAVSNKNAVSYFNYTNKRYAFTPEDKFTQLFDLTFDLSVHDLFSCWGSGGCLYVVPHEQLFLPAKFIQKNNISVWFSVPSTAIFMSKMKLLKPEALPSLRISLFCGEPLHESTVTQWCEAAPNSIVENLYGPTEATIAITNYTWNRDGENACHLGLVPIGTAFGSQKSTVVDAQLSPVAPGETGELVLGGSQVTAGYINNPKKTLEAFVSSSSLGEGQWYRTGDLVQLGQDGIIRYLGRMDQQVKIRGYRVELAEIEKVLREAAGQDLAIAVPLANTQGLIDQVVGVCFESPNPKPKIIATCKKKLPNYMVPSSIIFIDNFPMNTNGKVDRIALAEIIKGEK
jgi:amino acid adenylation domain-containing protein